MFLGCRRTVRDSFQQQCLTPKIYTPARRCKATTSKAKRLEPKINANKFEKDAGKTKAGQDHQNSPVHLAPSTTAPIKPPSLPLNTASREKTRRPIPTIGPPGHATRSGGAWKEGKPPPEFLIDLDLPPEKRWDEAIAWGVGPLRDIVARSHRPDDGYVFKNGIMRRVEQRYAFSNDQYAEMEGIATKSGIPFQKIVDFNLALNMQFGCTSGTAPLKDSSKLLHFRVLDPSYPLPHLLIHAHFIRRKRGEWVASAIMYLGHVAITTGVRQGLSVSINTRDNYAVESGMSQIARVWDWALYDPWSIVTRDLLLREHLPSLATAKKELERGQPDAYFSVVSDGRDAASLDSVGRRMVAWRDAEDGVLVQGNHYSEKESKFIIAERVASLEKFRKGRERVARLERLLAREVGSMDEGAGVSVPDLTEWISTPPVRHGGTALACIMDPIEGNIIWSAAYRGNS